MSEQELLRLQRVGDRLISAYSRLVDALPEHARGISGMSRYLAVNKATCQRIVEGAKQSDDALAAFLRFPGVLALRLHLKACRKRTLDPTIIDACEAATAQFEAELDHYKVSHRGFIDLIASLRSATDGADSALHRRRAMEQRRALFGAARRLTGEELKAKIAVALIRPSLESPDRLQIVVAMSLVGIVRQPFARPIVPFILTGKTGDSEQGAESVATDPGYRVLNHLSTTGLRTVRIPGSDAGMLLVAEADATRTTTPVDVSVVFYTGTPLNPASHPGARITAGVRVMQPTHLLIHDTYLHRSLDRRAVPLTGCFALSAPPGSGPGGGPDECWYERFPESNTLESLPLRVGTGQAGRTTPAERRAAELTTEAFRHVDADPDAYQGFRMQVKYPVWQSEYRVYFSSPG